MNSEKPPRLATWVLQEFGPELNQEALAGDLNEAFQQCRSKGWYWRQVLAAVRWRRLILPLLGSAAMAWLMTSNNYTPIILSRTIDMAVITVIYFAGAVAPGIKRRSLRILMGVFSAVTFVLIYYYKPHVSTYWLLLWMVAFKFAFERKARGPAYRSLTLGELVFGDPNAERQRLMEKLHLAMLQETDPQVRQAYAESIAALKEKEPPAVKAT